MRRIPRLLLALSMMIAAVSIAGCQKAQTPTLSPVVEAPAIGKSGILRAGVDLSVAPYGGVDGGRQAGLDVDVAAALADRLGLELQIVEVAPSEAATALAQGTVDIVLSVPFADTAAPGVLSAGTYAASAPAFFAAHEGTGTVEPQINMDTVTADKIGVQTGSAAHWTIRYEFGESFVEAYPSLRAAFQALSAGEIELVAGDAFVGAYLAREITGVAYAGQLSEATPLAVVTAEQNSELADAVREKLDEFAADGVLDTLRTKWVGDLPILSEEGF